MIKQYCDRCEGEIQPGILEGLSEDDTYATEGSDSYHFHITAMGGLLLCRDCFDSLLLSSLSLELAQQQVETEQDEAETQEEEQKEGEPLIEPKPILPGRWLGQKSPEGQWSWQGTGEQSDDWERVE